MAPVPLQYQSPQPSQPRVFVSGLLRATRASLILYGASVLTLLCLKLAYPMMGADWLSLVWMPAVAVGWCLGVFVAVFSALILLSRVWAAFFRIR